LVKHLLKLVGKNSPLAGLNIDEVESRNASLCKKDDPARRETYASILWRAQKESLTVEAEAPAPLEMMHWSMHSDGAMFAEVHVNASPGKHGLAASSVPSTAAAFSMPRPLPASFEAASLWASVSR
jgi:xanthine dehydrogenase YagR molybdenum-binding subunit